MGTVYDFGCFTIDTNNSDSFTICGDIIPPDGSVNTTSHPLGKQSSTRKLGDRIHQDTLDELGEFLKLKSIDKKEGSKRQHEKYKEGSRNGQG